MRRARPLDPPMLYVSDSMQVNNSCISWTHFFTPVKSMLPIDTEWKQIKTKKKIFIENFLSLCLICARIQFEYSSLSI